jgi:hypothetical protein
VSSRLVAVLGYSNGGEALHDICAARLRRAETEARHDDLVLLSGWARRRRRRSEAELMAEVWKGAGKLVVSGDARSTLGNARAAATLAKSVAANEVVLVTSAWHRRRASTLFRAALRGTGVGLTVAAVSDGGSVGVRVREILCWTLVPLQSALAARGSDDRTVDRFLEDEGASQRPAR